MTKYFTTKVPKGLANDIVELAVKKGSYSTVTEFVLESARRQLDNIK